MVFSRCLPVIFSPNCKRTGFPVGEERNAEVPYESIIFPMDWFNYFISANRQNRYDYGRDFYILPERDTEERER